MGARVEKWHNLSKEEVLKILDSYPSRLSKEKAMEWLKQYGLNELKEKGEIPWPIVFLRQFASPSHNESGYRL